MRYWAQYICAIHYRFPYKLPSFREIVIKSQDLSLVNYAILNRSITNHSMNRYNGLALKLNSLYYQVTDTEAVEPGDQRRGRLMAMYLTLIVIILVHVTVSNIAYRILGAGAE